MVIPKKNYFHLPTSRWHREQLFTSVLLSIHIFVWLKNTVPASRGLFMVLRKWEGTGQTPISHGQLTRTLSGIIDKDPPWDRCVDRGPIFPFRLRMDSTINILKKTNFKTAWNCKLTLNSCTLGAYKKLRKEEWRHLRYEEGRRSGPSNKTDGGRRRIFISASPCCPPWFCGHHATV